MYSVYKTLTLSTWMLLYAQIESSLKLECQCMLEIVTHVEHTQFQIYANHSSNHNVKWLQYLCNDAMSYMRVQSGKLPGQGNNPQTSGAPWGSLSLISHGFPNASFLCALLNTICISQQYGCYIRGYPECSYISFCLLPIHDHRQSGGCFVH